MEEFAKYVGNLLFYLIVGLAMVAIGVLLICVILLAVQGCLYTLGQITPMLSVR